MGIGSTRKKNIRGGKSWGGMGEDPIDLGMGFGNGLKIGEGVVFYFFLVNA